MSKEEIKRWGILWRSDNMLDGKREHLIWNWHDPHRVTPILFKTRRAARDYKKRYYNYLSARPDLKAEPHGWKRPSVVKVKCTFEVTL